MESSKKGKYIEYVSKLLCGSLAVYCLLFNNCIFPNRYCSVLTESMDSRQDILHFLCATEINLTLNFVILDNGVQ